jgi:tetratricopeptide (TPR) repeat protein
MPTWTHAKALGYFLLFFISVGLIGYGWMMRQFERAQNAYRQGDSAQALELYGSVESPFQKLPGIPALFKEEYKHLNLNQVAILYSQRKYQEALAKLEELPADAPTLVESADYSFWMGNLWFRQAVESKNPETSVNALKAALSEYQKGLVAQPDDWDLKFNYELVRNIFGQQNRNRQQQEQKVKTLIEKMRPQEPSRQEVAPEKRG